MLYFFQQAAYFLKDSRRFREKFLKFPHTGQAIDVLFVIVHQHLEYVPDAFMGGALIRQILIHDDGFLLQIQGHFDQIHMTFSFPVVMTDRRT
jgi:hypothetical protein